MYPGYSGTAPSTGRHGTARPAKRWVAAQTKNKTITNFNPGAVLVLSRLYVARRAVALALSSHRLRRTRMRTTQLRQSTLDSSSSKEESSFDKRPAP
eukprot:6192794-Pleurochrysis_carterae.AAC.5